MGECFRNISVGAERWLPIREVRRPSLSAEILRFKHRGYAIVGVEQTHNSMLLHEWRFVPNTVLLLGAEKEGIDAEILPLLDGCVEIPQLGQVRSLNVHTAGSLVVWEYIRQQRA